MKYRVLGILFLVATIVLGCTSVPNGLEPVSEFDGEGKAKMASKAANILTPCPTTPNCVSSLAKDKGHYVKPFPYKGEAAVAQHELLGILHSFNRVRVVRLEENYIHAEFVSFVFRFVDDVEFYFDDAIKVIQVKSASRIGYTDLGANRRRIEKIRKQLVLQ